MSPSLIWPHRVGGQSRTKRGHELIVRNEDHPVGRARTLLSTDEVLSGLYVITDSDAAII